MEHSMSKAGLAVRLRDNPGRQGVTTGQTRTVGDRLMTQVDFGPNEKAFKYADLLELVAAEEDLIDLLAAGRFGGPADLRRLLTLEKAKGDLTNVFYSMESSNTDFYPHQFKPVLKFIESSTRRLLIADEVGLGKTIEAMYIWKELQAREDARRLLIVCPSMLRQKWRDDLASRFGIAAEIVDAGQLRQKLEDLTERGIATPFVCIASLEGLRPPAGYKDEGKKSARNDCARIMEENPANDDFALFDLAIIDEAHYLRNTGTAAQRLGRLLHDAARNLILLTATPIQINSENLYRLLQLIDPVQFEDYTVFGDMLAANASIVRAQRALWRVPMDINAAHEAVEEALGHSYFQQDSVLERIRHILPSSNGDNEQRVEILRMLESRSLLSQAMTRSRKREVLERRVERSPQVASVHFSEREREVYRRVTARIRARASGMQGVSVFSLIARQRQMASSLPAALASWRDRGLLDELLWEDMGRSVSLDDDIEAMDDPLNMDILQNGEIDFAALEADDEKYKTLRDILLKHASEKCVVFAFFRGTLHYLERRLKADGISCTTIMGDMGDLKQDALARFRAPDGPQVLLSSEVGSEGIDLQFCRMLVNYDLPWNPMRVEQRIGRLDRLGQKADRISIINLKVEDTIEDRIVMRLYDRIDLFRDSIGDLEEILGDTTEKLMLELLNPQLSEEERDRLAEAAAVAVVNKRHEQNRLEQEAVNLLGFSDYILDSIRESRSHGRWLGGEELLEFVEDFFARKYPGAKIEPDRKIPLLAKIRLPEDARASLGNFISESRPATRTRLHQSSAPVACLFDPRAAGDAKDVERIDPTHPLIQWIRTDYLREAHPLHPVAAVRMTTDEAGMASGHYAFAVHRWSFQGLKSDHVLAFRAALIGGDALPDTASEGLVAAAARHGKLIPNAAATLPDLNAATEAALHCEELLADAFDKRARDAESENALRSDQQKTSAEAFARRRIVDFQARIEKFHASGRQNLIPMTEGLIKKEQQQLQIKLERINKRRSVDSDLTPLAAGIILVEQP